MTINSSSSTAVNLKVLTKQQKIAAGSMVSVAVAAFLPWVSVLGFSVIGFRGDGKLTLLAALAGLAAFAFGTDVIGRRRLSEMARISIAGSAAGITVLTAFSAMNDFAAIGLYITLIAGIAWVAALVWEYSEQKKARTSGS